VQPAQGKRAKPAPVAESTLGSGAMARVPSGTFGPHLALTDVGAFVAWAEPAADGVRWHTMVSATKTRLRLGPELPKTTGMLSFFELGRAKGGAALAWVAKRDRLEVVSVTLLKPSGVSAPQELSAEEGEVLWAQSAPDPRGTRVLWARRRGASAEISTALLSDVGIAGPSETLRKDSIGWQLAEGPAGTWLASVEGSSGAAKLVLVRLDVPAPERRAIEVAERLTGPTEVDLWVGDAAVVAAFSDGAEGAPRLQMAEVAPNGAVSVASRAITGPRGEQALLELVTGVGGARPWLAWEEPALDGASWRRVLLARLQPNGIVAPEAWLDVHGERSLLPGLAQTSGQLVALTREAPLVDAASGNAPSGLSISTLAVDSAGARVARMNELPVALDRDALCWDLECGPASCAVLCAQSDSPTSVHFVPLEPREALAHAGVSVGATGPLHALVAAPRLLRREVVAAAAAVSDLTIAEGDGRTLLSWVTDFDPALRPAKLERPAPDGRLEPYQAELRALCLEGGGAATDPRNLAEPKVVADTVVSRRARSLGGVSLSPERAGRRVLGWAALDQGKAHVFATLLDAQGKKLKQRLLGRKSGEVTDVQAVTTKTGFLLLWVDDRAGSGQVYAQAVDPELNPVGPERALTTQASAPIGLAVFSRGDELLLGFADGDGDGSDRIFVMSIDARTLATVGAPRELPGSDGHVHSPQFFGDVQGGVGIAFVETRETPAQGTVTAVRLVALDTELRPVRAPRTLFPEVDPSAFALHCDERGCRAVAISADARRSEIWAAASVDGISWRSEFVLALDGDAQLLPTPVLGRDAVYLAGPAARPSAPETPFSVERLVIDFGQGAPAR